MHSYSLDSSEIQDCLSNTFHHGNPDLIHNHTDISTGYYSALGLH